MLAADEFGLPSIDARRAAGRLRRGGDAARPDGRAAPSTASAACRWRWPGAAVCAVLVALLGLRAHRGRLAALWFATGLGSALVWAGINTLAVEAVPGNRAGGTSVVSAFKFAGNAAAPVMWLPLYHVDPASGFLGAAVMAALTGAFIAPLSKFGP